MTIRFFMAAMLLMIGSIFNQAKAEIPFVDSESRVYLEPSQIFISGNAITVLIDGQPTSIERLFSDNNGIYCKFPSGERDWHCPICNAVNGAAATFCGNCSWQIGDPYISIN